MTIEAQYAKALFDLVTQNPKRAADCLDGLKKTLTRKGHQKLLPRIFAEYTALLERAERSSRYSAASPEKERTRKLLELYRTLVATT